MKNNIVFSVVVLAILTGCQLTAGFEIKATTETTHQIPPEIGGPGTGKETTKIESRIFGNACYPQCSKSLLNSQLQQFNLLIEQQNTYSTPINQKGLIHVYDRDTLQPLASNAVDLVTVGNQIKLANPAIVTDWIYPFANRNLEITVVGYFDTVGYSGTQEYVTFKARSGTHVLDIDGVVFTINCGPELSNGQPEQACSPE